ncbi:MAG: hypothetical protein V3W34_06775 [Phycisphaerae bacterium]
MKRSWSAGALCRTGRLARVSLWAMILCAVLGDSTAWAQRAVNRRPIGPNRVMRAPGRRPAPRGMARSTRLALRGSAAGRGRNALGINRRGLGRTDVSGFIHRPRSLLYRAGYTAPLTRMSLSSTVAGLRNAPSQADIERAIEEIKTSNLRANEYSRSLAAQIDLQGRQLVDDGWGYFQDGDYLRARSAFESAEIVDRHSPVPRFGQLIVDVAQSHYRRAITLLAKSISYDARRPPGIAGLFEYDVSLQEIFGDEKKMLRSILQLRQFAQENLDNPAVQALYCYVLWYSRIPDSAAQASGIAAQLARTVSSSNSPWARFPEMIERAEAQIGERGGAD